MLKPENPESLSESAWEPPDFMMRGLFAGLEWLSAFLLVLIFSPAGRTTSVWSTQIKGWASNDKK